jgi:acyl carrier protein
MKPTPEQIHESIADIVRGMTKGWDLDADQLGPETRLVSDLGFSSVDIIHLMASTEMRFNRKLPYDEIVMRDGRYVDDLSLRELIEFVGLNFDRAASGS